MVWRDMVVGRDATLAEVQVAYSFTNKCRGVLVRSTNIRTRPPTWSNEGDGHRWVLLEKIEDGSCDEDQTD